MSWGESIIGLLANELPEAEILNAGVVSYSPKLIYLKLKYLIEIVQFSFDEVYVLIVNSDIMDKITYADFTPYNNNSLKTNDFKLMNYFLIIHISITLFPII